MSVQTHFIGNHVAREKLDQIVGQPVSSGTGEDLATKVVECAGRFINSDLRIGVNFEPLHRH